MNRLARPIARVLLTDDEAAIRTFVGRILRDGGYEVTVASDAQEALGVVEGTSPFDLFIVDVQLPGIQGDELVQRLRQIQPDAKVLYFTGYSDRLFEERIVLSENEAFINKPMAAKALLEAVSLMLFGDLRGPNIRTDLIADLHGSEGYIK